MTDRAASRGTAEDAVEVEWQFDALDLRPVERWLGAFPPPLTVGAALAAPTAQAKPTRRLVDRYLDTEDWRVGRAGFVLRTRQRGRNDEATLKDTRPAGAGGLRRRLEVSEALPAGGLSALGSDGPVGRRIAAVAGRHPFVQILEVRTRRRPFTLQVAGEEVAEVALDDTVITVGPDEQPVRLRRVEVEVVPSWVDALRPLVEDLRRSCGLQPATLSKFEAGLLALGVEVPGLPDLGPTEVTPDSNLGDLALAVIRVHIGVLLAREPGTRLGEDIEELHDMRVATRRLRAAIDFFVDALPVRAQTFRSELTWLAGVLGNVRDLDVQIDRLDEMDEWVTAGVAPDNGDGGSPLEELRVLLASQRAWARRDLLDALDSSRWERLASGLVAMVQPVPRRRTPTARQPATAVLPDLVTSRHRAVMKAARRARRSGQAPDFHRLRIRGKRLRYSLEFTAGVYGGRTERFTRKLAKLQDALGLMQDAEVATARLLALATSAGAGGPDRLPPRTVFAMGAVAERYRVESAELLTQMARRLAVLDGAEWRDLSTHMVSRRLQALATVPAARPTQALGVVVPETVDRSEPAGWGGAAAGTEPPASGAAAPSDRREPDTMRAVPAPAEAVVPSPGSAPLPAAAALSAWPDSAWGPPRPGAWPVAPPPAGAPTAPAAGPDADKDAGNDEYHHNGSATHRPASAHPTGTDGG